MKLMALLESLKNLKQQVEESIALVESSHSKEVDTRAIQVIDRCSQSLQSICLAVCSPSPANVEDQDLEHLNGQTVKNPKPMLGLCDQKQSTSNQNGDLEGKGDKWTEKEMNETVDDLDDLDFDDFFDKADKPKALPSTSGFTVQERDVYSDSEDFPSDCDPDEEQMIRDEMSKEGRDGREEGCLFDSVIEKDDKIDNDSDKTEENDFDDLDLDDEALGLIEEAERSVMEETDVIQIDEDEPDDVNQPSEQCYLEILKQHFGYSKFRPTQWKIINSVLNDRRDNCVVMATGYGKSLTFQFPSVFTKRISVIISPLISLMEDQVHGLLASNIDACFLGSAQQKTAEVKQAMFQGRYRLVYVTPEFISTAISDIKRLDQEIGIDLIAIDEAHCVSQWGHDFRPSYQQLGILKREFPKIPILAVTATATLDVQKDICRSLKLVNPSITCTGFDRPNLYLSVGPKTGNIEIDLKNEMKKVGYKFSFDGPTIVYCPTKKVTEEVAAALGGMNVPCLPYHASLSLSARKKAHQQFLNDQIQVIVATVAFGMGIDKPDVRKVIHYGAPKDIESYYQEIGRAGRDGMPSTCTAIFSKSDFNISRHFISQIGSERFRDHKMKMLNKMEKYLSTKQCRRRVLLSYFEAGNLDEFGGTENCCDCCRLRINQLKRGLPVSEQREEAVNYAKEAEDLFKAIECTGNRYGLGVPTQVLTGSAAKKIQPFKSSKMFGSGKYRSIKFWSALGKALIYEGFLKEKSVQGGFGSTVEMTPKSRSWLNQVKAKDGDCELLITPTGELAQEEELRSKKAVTVTILPSSSVPSKASPSVSGISTTKTSPPGKNPSQYEPAVDPETARLQTDLYAKLVKTRNQISQDTGFTPHNIASNRLLLDMAKFRPSNRAALLKLEDFSEVKVDRFGDKFTALIKVFCEQNSLKLDDFPIVLDNTTEYDSLGPLRTDIMKLTETQRQSYILFMMQKKPLEEVASRRGFKTSTIISHLCEALKLGLNVDLERLVVTPKIEKLITDTIMAPPINGEISSLTKIKDQLPLYVEYNHIKVVISLLIHKHGQETNADGKLVLCGVSHQNVTDVDMDETDSSINHGMAEEPVSPVQASKRLRMESPPSTSPTSPRYSLSKHQSLSIPRPGTTLRKSVSETPSTFCCQTSLSTFQSQNSDSQSTSQADSQRKLPSWMGTSGNKTVFKKKMKSNSLFK